SAGQSVVIQYTFLMPVLSQVDDVASEQVYAVQPNSLANPSFETSPLGLISGTPTGGWKISNVGTGTSTIESANPHSGSHDAVLTNPSTGNYGGIYQGQGIAVTAGQVLTASVWAKGSAAGNANTFRMTFANPGSIVNSQGIASAQPSAQAGVDIFGIAYNVTTTYKQYSQTVIVPPG